MKHPMTASMKAAARVHHVTVGGRPLCAAGASHGQDCEHRSMASARRAAAEVRRCRPGAVVRVVPGKCPVA